MLGLLTLLRSSKHPRLLFNPPGICGTRSLSSPVHSGSVPAATSPKVWPCQENGTWFAARTQPKDDGSWEGLCCNPLAGFAAPGLAPGTVPQPAAVGGAAAPLTMTFEPWPAAGAGAVSAVI